jgi:hypothetical protein
MSKGKTSKKQRPAGKCAAQRQRMENNKFRQAASRARRRQKRVPQSPKGMSKDARRDFHNRPKPAK